VIALAGLAEHALTQTGRGAQVPDWKIFDSPRQGTTVSNGWLEWQDRPPPAAGWYTAHCPDQTVRGFLLTGDRKCRESARRMWHLSATRSDGRDRFAGFDVDSKFDYKNCTVNHVALTLWAWTHAPGREGAETVSEVK